MSTRKERIAQNKKTMGKQYGASIKIGKKGKNYNRYNPKTGRWEKVMSANGKAPKFTSTKSTPAKNTGGVGKKTQAAKVKRNPVAATGGFVRGSGAYAAAGKKPAAGSVAKRTSNARHQNTTYAGRNAAAILGMTAAPFVAGGAAAAVGRGAAAAAGRAAIGGSSRKALTGAPKAIGRGTAKSKPSKTTVTDMRNGRTSTARPVPPKKAIGRGTSQQRATAAASKARRAIKPTKGQATAGSRYAAMAAKTKKKK